MMLKAEHIETYGWEAAIRGARNPLNSWSMSDSIFCDMDKCETCRLAKQCREECSLEYQDFYIGERDLDLMRRLVKAGSDHGKFMRMIGISMDITSNHVWWAEFDTYKVGTVRNSCSKMHKIHAKAFEPCDFSHEGIDEVGGTTKVQFMSTMNELEHIRTMFNETHDKKYWRAMIELLPCGYNLRATVTLNYAVARNIYHARKNHKMFEWHELCRVFEELPYSELITEADT